MLPCVSNPGIKFTLVQKPNCERNRIETSPMNPSRNAWPGRPRARDFLSKQMAAVGSRYSDILWVNKKC